MSKNDLSDLLINPKISQSSSGPEGTHVPAPPQPQKGTGALWLVLILSLGMIAALGFLAYQSYQQQTLHSLRLAQIGQSLEAIQKRLDSNASQLASLQSQLEVTMKRVGVTQADLKRARALAENIMNEQRRNVEQLNQEIAAKANAEQLANFQSEAGQKFQGVHKDINSVKDEVKNNQQELSTTLSRLSDLGVRVTKQGEMIATNGQSLEELRKRGERDYVSFEIKKKQKDQLAGIGLELRGTDRKHQKAHVKLYFDDRVLDRKDIFLNTPLNFYVGAQRVQYELVINKIEKHSIGGYISVPKGKLPSGPPALKAAAGSASK